MKRLVVAETKTKTGNGSNSAPEPPLYGQRFHVPWYEFKIEAPKIN